MADLLKTGAAWLAGKLKSHASQDVIYRRGDLECTLAATLGSMLLRTSDGRGNSKTVKTDRDFIFTAADLVGIDLPPQRGDLIDLPVGDVTERYELLPYGHEEPVFQWADPDETMVRCHGKYRGTV